MQNIVAVDMRVRRSILRISEACREEDAGWMVRGVIIRMTKAM